MKHLEIISLCVAAAIASTLPAQTPPARQGPSKVLQLYREEVKYGRASEHEKYEAGWPRAFSKAKWPVYAMGLSSVTGPSEAWFAIGYESFADMEKDRINMAKNAALDAELSALSKGDAEFVSNARSIVAVYREDLSRPGNVVLATQRYFEITTFRVRPGHDLDFEQAAKLYRDTYNKVNNPTPWAVYQVMAGMPSPTYFVFVPRKSLGEVDQDLAQMGNIMQAFGEENLKTLQKLAADGFLTAESNYFAFSPKMSYMPKEFVARDPEFWTPKP